MQQTYTLHRIQGLTDERLERFHQFLNANYKPSLVDPLEIITQELRDTKRMKGGYKTPHAIVVAENNNGEIIAAASGNLLPVNYQRGEESLGINFISYVAPEKGNEGKNNPLYSCISRLEEILGGYSSKRGMKVPVTVLEAEQDKEKIKTYKSWDFEELEGVKYIQPPLDWDDKGNPLEKAQELKLMARYMDNKALKMDVAQVKDGANRLRRGLVGAVGNYLYDQWYTPYGHLRPDKANERIWDFNHRKLRGQFQKSLGTRKFIASSK